MSRDSEGPTDFREFVDWLRAVPEDDLRRLVIDAYWKKQLADTELVRAFLLFQKGVNLIH